nr:MAG TPA: hypothetical protein [Bacteriophage sp.]
MSYHIKSYSLLYTNTSLNFRGFLTSKREALSVLNEER